MENFHHLEIQLEVIKLATSNFRDDNIIGVGGFGKVFKGFISNSKGQIMVALKRLDRRYGQGDPEFLKEIMMLSHYKHPNLISLLGFCNEDGEKILVYEHALHGSLDRHLSSTSLTWIKRLKIRVEAARGISYLHDPNGTQQRVLHRDIKSSNILLDENWNAKVSDFGLSKIGPANQQHSFLFTNVVGTPGYLDPQYLKTYLLTKESDVYSFGVVLFEVLCGRVCFESNDGQFYSLVQMWKQSYKQKKLDDIIFQDMDQQMDPSSLETFSTTAYQCLQKNYKQRPTMSQVVKKLEIALEIQETYDLKKYEEMIALEIQETYDLKKYEEMIISLKKYEEMIALQIQETYDLKKYEKMIALQIQESYDMPLDYEEMIKTSVPPLIYTSQEELKTLLTKGVILNMGKTWFSINKNGQHCEMISAAECIIPLSNTDNSYSHEYASRFVTGNCLMFRWKFQTHIQTQFLSPKTVYTVNLVFKIKKHKWSSYGEPTYVTIGADPSFLYFADEREDGWLTAKLYKFTSEGRYVDLEIIFESIANYDSSVLVVEGIEFQPLEKVDHEDETDGQIAKELYLFFGRGFPIKYVEGTSTRFIRIDGTNELPSI